MSLIANLEQQPQAQIRFADVVRPLQPAFVELEAFLTEQISEFEPEVQPLARYTFGHSGKKLRPLLVFAMGLAPQQTGTEELLQAAAIVELVHLATLVHDDILDVADMRHGTETVVSRYGAHVAVLLGDALFAHALHLAAQYPTVEICRAVSLATRQVCSGEIAQTFARAQTIPSLAQYYRCIDLKTAELFAVSAYLGAFLGGLDRAGVQAAQTFARAMGIAYQIYDDVADLFAAETKAGKTLGTDLATGKLTLPTLLWLESLPAVQRQREQEQLLAGTAGMARLRDAIHAAGTMQDVAKAFDAQMQIAEAALQAPFPSERRELPLKLLQFLSESFARLVV